MSKLLWLRIDQQDSLQKDLIEITWEPIYQLVEMPAIKEYRKECDRNAYKATMRTIKNEMKVGSSRNLIRAGENLFRNFVDKEFFNRFHQSHEIYISTRMIYVPWELVKDTAEGEQPWGVKYAIGNQIRSPLDVREEKLPAYKEHIDVLLIAAMANDLQYAEKEVEEIRDYLLQDDRIRCEILVKKPPKGYRHQRVQYFKLSYDTVLSKLQESNFDIIHYAGHIVEPDRKEMGSALVIEKDKNEYLYSTTIYDNLAGTPFVFLNGCSMMWEKALRTITNIADGFILGGARGVLVPRTEITDHEAKRIAVKYYQYLLSGQTFGEALRLIRKEDYERDPSHINWITYILFGIPNLRLFSLEKEIFLADSEKKTKILNARIFEQESVDLLRMASGYALKSKSKSVAGEHLFISLTQTKDFAAIYADQAGDDLWKVLRALRHHILGPNKDIITQVKELEELPVKEELMSAQLLDLLKHAHSASEKAGHNKIHLTDLCRVVLESEKMSESESQKLNNAIAAVANEFHLKELSSLQELAQAHHTISFQKELPDSLRNNAYTIDGQINRDIATEKVNGIFAKCALFQRYVEEKLQPEDIFYISGLLPGTNMSAFFEKEKFELNDYVRGIQDSLTEGEDERKELELSADVLDKKTDNIIKQAVKTARWQSTKLGEKQLIRSIIDHIKMFGSEDIPDIEFLEKLEYDTVFWQEN